MTFNRDKSDAELYVWFMTGWLWDVFARQPVSYWPRGVRVAHGLTMTYLRARKILQRDSTYGLRQSKHH